MITAHVAEEARGQLYTRFLLSSGLHSRRLHHRLFVAPQLAQVLEAIVTTPAMAPKRRADVLVLDSDDDEIAPRNAPGPRAGSSVRSTTPTGGAADADQFEQDLALAMRLSMEDAGTPSNATGSGSTSTGPAAATAAPNANSSRAELERARLERQRAREADGTAQPSVISASRAPVRRPTPRSRVATLADLPSGEDTGSGGSGASSLRAGGASSQSKLSQRFWDGAVKRVPNDYVPDDESFSFGDLIGPRQTLETAVVSAFCLDPLWVASHFPEETPLLLVMPRGPGDTLPGFAPFGVKGNTFRAVPPTRLQQGAGVMHTKLMVRSVSLDAVPVASLADRPYPFLQLYIHHDFLRIVIPTANAISYDWSIIDNAFYIHDFPLLAEHAEFSADGGEELGTLNPLENPTHTQFSRSFIQVCISRSTLLFPSTSSHALTSHAIAQSWPSLNSSSRVQSCTTFRAAETSASCIPSKVGFPVRACHALHLRLALICPLDDRLAPQSRIQQRRWLGRACSRRRQLGIRDGRPLGDRSDGECTSPLIREAEKGRHLISLPPPKGLVNRPLLQQLVGADAGCRERHSPVLVLSFGQRKSDPGSNPGYTAQTSQSTADQDHFPDRGRDPQRSRRSQRKPPRSHRDPRRFVHRV